MRFSERPISHERCEEINRMEIVCPWNTDVFRMNEKGSRYITNEDESIIYAAAFSPRPQELAYDDHGYYYLLVKGDRYFLHAPKLVSQKTEKIDGVLHVSEILELPDDEKINSAEDKDHIIDLINFLYFHNFYHDKRWVFKQTMIYNGKEYTGEGVGEYI